ncbi:MAG: SOS response-associated peptidase [Proteobacteria bacterium]|nr:SOS response-associated peptidase [Pseudomonadota bacterium]MBI3499139.1 SOS response-associated peptidase [Pseudomonadota bacterium]
MCGRYSLITPTEALRQLMAFMDLLNLEPRYNVAPTQMMPVVRPEEGGRRRLVLLRWGLIPSWAKDATIGAKCINARTESVAEKPAFRTALRQRRCLVLADGYYEWRQEGKAKQPYRIVLKAGGPFAIAGIWEGWRSPAGEPIESFALITTVAGEDIAHIHDRMPVILAPEDYALWLDPDPAQLPRQLELLRPSPKGLISAYAVSMRVNFVRNDDEECIRPAAPAAPTLF